MTDPAPWLKGFRCYAMEPDPTEWLAAMRKRYEAEHGPGSWWYSPMGMTAPNPPEERVLGELLEKVAGIKRLLAVAEEMVTDRVNSVGVPGLISRWERFGVELSRFGGDYPATQALASLAEGELQRLKAGPVPRELFEELQAYCNPLNRLAERADQLVDLRAMMRETAAIRAGGCNARKTGFVFGGPVTLRWEWDEFWDQLDQHSGDCEDSRRLRELAKREIMAIGITRGPENSPSDKWERSGDKTCQYCREYEGECAKWCADCWARRRDERERLESDDD